MITYCPYCGRQVPNDAIMCSYCTKNISHNKITSSQTYQQPEKKDNKKLIAIIAIVVIILVALPAIAATIYVYVSGMTGPSGYHMTPILSFVKNTETGSLTVIHVDPSTLRWEELTIQGTCDTTGLTGYVGLGQLITNCEGTISIIYIPTNSLLGTYDFS